MKTTQLYPLKFTPISKEKVWGGTRLKTLYNKEGAGNIGESWELSGVPGAVSMVANGPLQGSSLNKIIEQFKDQLVGDKVYDHFGDQFPLLFKFIDAREDLSVQLHPDDALAQSRHDSFGKTEMWYIMEATADARLILGFNKKMDETTYVAALSENKILDILHSEPVQKGDSFFIAPGTVHAIGGGILLAEIQQTSDITYRIYDWDRPGVDGKLRELHTDLAAAAIDYSNKNARLRYTSEENTAVLLCRSPYFETNRWVLSQNVRKSLQENDSFTVYMCVEGAVTVRTETHSERIIKGETLLIPACIESLSFETENATLLEVYIP